MSGFNHEQPYDPAPDTIHGVHDALDPSDVRWREEYVAARTDPLTGIYNRRWLSEVLDVLTESQPGDFALSFVDLDDLKRVNDTAGHEAGNELLVSAARTLQRCLVSVQDKTVQAELVHAAVRLSGDEYVLVFRGVNDQETLDRIMQYTGRCLSADSIGASIGGRPHRPGESGTDLLTSVDELMYEQKLQRKQAKFDALPRHKRVAARIGTRLLHYAGMNPPRNP